MTQPYLMTTLARPLMFMMFTGYTDDVIGYASALIFFGIM